MPQIPQYNREVKLNGQALPYQRYELNENMFGGGEAKSLMKAGDDVNRTVNLAMAIADRIDDAKMLELSNQINQWEEQNLYDKENGYFSKTGKEAVGQSESIMKNFDEFVNGYMANNKISGINETRMNDMISRHKSRISRGVNSWDIRQTEEWAKNESELGLSNAIKGMVKARNNPEEIKTQLANINTIIDWQGQTQRLDATSVELMKQNAISQAHSAVLDAYIADGDLRAGEYFEENKDSINPEKHAGYISSVKNLELSYKARNIAQSLIGLSLENAYSKINSISDIHERNAVLHEYNLLTNQKEEVQREKSNQIMEGLSSQIGDVLANGGNPSKLKLEILKSDLSWEAKKKQIDFINDCVSLNQEANLWSDKETLEELKVTDYETFRKVDLSQYALTKSEREKFLKEQKEVKNYTTEKQLRDIVKKIDTRFNIGGGIDGNVYKNELIGLFARIERLQGKAFNLKSIDEGTLKQFIEGFNYKEKEMPNELKNFGIKNFKNIDETKELYMRAKQVANIQEDVARKYVQFKYDNGREPEPSEMYGIVQKVYMDAARQNWQDSRNRVQNEIILRKNINSSQIKKVGYTKVLTNFEERTIPDIERQTGVKMVITSTYRSTGKYGHEKGMKADVFPKNPTKENITKSAEALLASPDVAIVFTSNPYVLDRFRGHPKLKDATGYDKTEEAKRLKINHITHFDITLSNRFGGTEQIKPSVLAAKK